MKSLKLVLVAAVLALSSCGGALKQPVNDVIDCAAPEIADAVYTIVCKGGKSPAEIATQVAWCIAEKQIHHLFGANYCGDASVDGGK